MFELTAWHWFTLACVLLVLEITIPVAFFLWMAAAALATMLVAILLPSLGWHLGWQVEVGLFSTFALLSLIIWAKRPKQEAVTDQPGLNERNYRYLGATVVVCNEIKNGRGKVKVNDSIWQARGVDAKIGTQMQVVRVEGSVFHVEPM